MSARTLAIALLAWLCVAGCAGLDRRSDVASGVDSADRQLLVMLRMPVAHFRPDLDYGGSYDSRTGRHARRRIADALAGQYGLRLIDDWSMPALGVDCFVMQAPNRVSLEQLLEALSSDPRVESAQAMNVFQVLASNDPLYSLQPAASAWHLSDVHRITTGKRVRVAEIDTIVETEHPDLAGQVAVVHDFVVGRAGSAETHGTAVAGIIAARANNGVGIAGVAPDARLLALRACWQAPGRAESAVCNSFTLARALQAALDERAQVINLSIGGPRDRLLARLLDAALARGITVVGAADPTLLDGGFPASHEGVLAIAGEHALHLADHILRAPARDIPTTMMGRQWGFVSGSSYAAAHVSGLVALLRELAPDLQPSQIRQALASSTAAGANLGKYAIVDACAAVAKTAGMCACACAEPRVTTLSSP